MLEDSRVWHAHLLLSRGRGTEVWQDDHRHQLAVQRAQRLSVQQTGVDDRERGTDQTLGRQRGTPASTRALRATFIHELGEPREHALEVLTTGLLALLSLREADARKRRLAIEEVQDRRQTHAQALTPGQRLHANALKLLADPLQRVVEDRPHTPLTVLEELVERTARDSSAMCDVRDGRTCVSALLHNVNRSRQQARTLDLNHAAVRQRAADPLPCFTALRR